MDTIGGASDAERSDTERSAEGASDAERSDTERSAEGASDAKRSAEGASDVEAIISASVCYNEVFRKTALRNISNLGITKTQAEALAALDIDGPLKMSDLSDKIFIAREQATRAIRSLQGQGLVECVRPQENRRIVIASLTEKGKRLLENHKKASGKILESYLERLAGEEREALVSHSKAAADILRRNNFFPGSKG